MDNLDHERFSILIPKKKIYQDALLNATDDERIALGVSYHKTYARLCLSVHP